MTRIFLTDCVRCLGSMRRCSDWTVPSSNLVYMVHVEGLSVFRFCRTPPFALKKIKAARQHTFTVQHLNVEDGNHRYVHALSWHCILRDHKISGSMAKHEYSAVMQHPKVNRQTHRCYSIRLILARFVVAQYGHATHPLPSPVLRRGLLCPSQFLWRVSLPRTSVIVFVCSYGRTSTLTGEVLLNSNTW